jgi:hypothetical protein
MNALVDMSAYGKFVNAPVDRRVHELVGDSAFTEVELGASVGKEENEGSCTAVLYLKI